MATKSWLWAASLKELSASLRRPATAENLDCHFWLADASDLTEIVGLVETSTTSVDTARSDDAASGEGGANTIPAAMAAAPTPKTAEYQTRNDVDMIPLQEVGPRRSCRA